MLYHWSLLVLFCLSHTYLNGADQSYLELLDDMDDVSHECLMGLDDYSPKRLRTGLTPDPSPCRDALFENTCLSSDTFPDLSLTIPDDSLVVGAQPTHTPVHISPSSPCMYIDICSPDEDNPVHLTQHQEPALLPVEHRIELIWEQRFRRLEESIASISATMTTMNRTLYDVAQQVALLQQPTTQQSVSHVQEEMTPAASSSSHPALVHITAQQSAKRSREEITPAAASSSSAALVQPVVTLAQRMQQMGEIINDTVSDMHALEQATTASSLRISSLITHPLFYEWKNDRSRVRPDTLYYHLRFIEEFKQKLPAALCHSDSNFLYRLTLEKAWQYLRAYERNEPLPPGQTDKHFYLRSGYYIFITINAAKISKSPSNFEGKIIPSPKHLYAHCRKTFYNKLFPILPNLASTLASPKTS